MRFVNHHSKSGFIIVDFVAGLVLATILITVASLTIQTSYLMERRVASAAAPLQYATAFARVCAVSRITPSKDIGVSPGSLVFRIPHGYGGTYEETEVRFELRDETLYENSRTLMKPIQAFTPEVESSSGVLTVTIEQGSKAYKWVMPTGRDP